MRKPAVLMVSLLALAGCPAPAKAPLFTPGTEIPVDDPSGAMLRRLEVRIRLDALTPGRRSTIVFPIPEDDVEVELRPVDPAELALPAGAAAWTGTVEGGGEAFVMRIGRAIEASLLLGNRSYRLRTLEGQRGVLEVFDSGRFREAPGDGVVDPNPPQPGPSQPDSSCVDSSERVDVMVLYTPAAMAAAGGATAIENEIAFSVGLTNLAYRNSNVAHRLNLTYAGVVAFTEPSAGVDSNALLLDLASTSDGVLDEVHGLRDGQRADLVSLIYETDGASWCGWGHLEENANADTTAHRAFTVVQRSCASANLSFAHEIGHNFGAQHDLANASSSTVGFNYGHIQPVPATPSVAPWRTVMSYQYPCGSMSATGNCMRVPWFSNPDVIRFGDATGVPLTSSNPEHNVRMLAQTDGEVSRYRCLHDSAGANVWMKDRWEDQGREPDPATAGMRMWESPYIWVRRAEDTSLEHEHEHENPVMGRTNYVYVKLHNTGASPEAASLELYFADASTNLNSPASWTRIDTQSLTVAEGVRVARFAWNDLPGAGHYCLMARWNTDGSPLAFSDIDQYVRGSNDTIWRNVNIQDLGADPEARHVFEMVGQDGRAWTYLLVETEPRGSAPLPWGDLMRVRLSVEYVPDPDLPLTATNMTAVVGEPGTYEVPLDDRPKHLGPFALRPGERMPVVFHVSADPQLVRETSRRLANPAELALTASQIQGSDAAQLALEAPSALFQLPSGVLGGVTFHLRVPAAE